MRTQQEIERQIEGLKKMKATLPKKSMFGDDNWAKIDAQISILDGSKRPDHYYNDESSEDYQDGDNEIYFEADAAEQWLNGSTNDDLFDEE